MSVIVVMGAAVRHDGSLSGALSRRIQAALALSSDPETIFMVTGGGPPGRTEADAMASFLVKNGIPLSRIVKDGESVDTLSSVTRCAQLLHALPSQPVIVCSDRYHVPRCVWLLRLLGIKAAAGRIPSGLKANGVWLWTYYYLREAPALVWDTVLLLSTRGRKAAYSAQ